MTTDSASIQNFLLIPKSYREAHLSPSPTCSGRRPGGGSSQIGNEVLAEIETAPDYEAEVQGSTMICTDVSKISV